MEKKSFDGWQNFLDLCLQVSDKKTLSLLFDFFLTDNEKESIAMRLLIIQELIAEKKPQREIAHDLKVSIAKITRGSNELKRVEPKLLRLLQRNSNKK